MTLLVLCLNSKVVGAAAVLGQTLGGGVPLALVKIPTLIKLAALAVASLLARQELLTGLLNRMVTLGVNC